jgi:hypothetical protein
MFEGRKLLIATKHEKEKVIAPILENALGVQCFIIDDFDTDQLGTFSGEVERKDDPFVTAIKKCQLAMEKANCDLAIASEGSFGPHPLMFFVPADYEILVLVDKKNQLKINTRELSTQTNFNVSEIRTVKELRDFALNAKFPSHGLIIKNSQEKFTEIVKGITDYYQLEMVFEQFMKRYNTAFVETDMRAMYNPTRMKVIAIAAEKLALKAKSLCPNCNTPGFVITSSKKGLTCKICSFPTQSKLSHSYLCQKCFYSEEIKFPNGKLYEDPMHCDVCNP